MRRTLLNNLIHAPLTEASSPSNGETAVLADTLDTAARKRLGRSLSIRLVDAGSCNACELEINALSNAYYDLERFGLRFVASPRHADVLMVTGPVTKNMQDALERTYQAMPAPKWVVAVGNCAIGCGLLSAGYASIGEVASVLPVDLQISGCPPSPPQLLNGLLRLLSTDPSSCI